MAKRVRKKTTAWIVLFALAAVAAYTMYASGYFDWWLGELASGAGKFNLAMCGRAGIGIESVECKNKVVYVTLSNTGRMPLNGNFLAAVSTDRMQVFVANDTESVIRPGQAGKLALALEGLEGPIWKVTVAFQPCGKVTAEKEELAISC